MKNQVLIFTLAFNVVGCLDENQPPRPGPADQGIEDNFDARQPPVAPNTGSGYGSGYSGSAPPNQDAGQSLNDDSEDMRLSDAESEGFLDAEVNTDDS